VKRFLLPALITSLTTPAHALIDTDTDGLGDIWENIHGFHIGANPPANQAPSADPDGDGFTNLQESTAGTNPLDREDFPKLAFSLTPPVYEPLPPGAEPPPSSPPPTDPFDPNYIPPPPALVIPRILLDPPVSTLTWHTVPGKSYEAFPSENLSDWTTTTGAFLGAGLPHTFESESLYPDGTVPPKLFWRVEITDTDSDGDGLTDYEELHTTDPNDPGKTLDPFNPDTDGDGIPDNIDPEPFTNSLQAVWDADSVDPSGAPLFASFHFTPPTAGGYPFTAEHVTDISGNNHHGLARTAFHSPPAPENAPQDNAEGIANHGFLCGGTHHHAFGVKSPAISFAPLRSLSFWLKADASAIAAAPQPVFSYIPKDANRSQPTASINYHAIRAFIARNPTNTGYEVIWKNWSNPANEIRERWTLDLPEREIDGRWLNLTFIWQGTGSGQEKLWACHANGVKQNRLLGSTYLPNSTTGAIQDTFLIGADAIGGLASNNQATIGSIFAGVFDRVRLHTAALTPAQILAIFQQDTDKDGLRDDIEIAATTWKDLNGNGRRDIGEIRFPNGSPLIWQAPGTDSDGDGLTDIYEQNISRTDPYYHDSDGNLLPDGWEVANNLDPNSAVGNDGASGDPDNDGLDNFDEWRFLTDPHLADTDGDSVSDGAEITQGSDPSSGQDNGQAPPPEEKLTLRIIVGDPSGSHSERWRVEATEVESGEVVLRHASRQYGQVTTAAESTFNKFKPGKAYSFQLIHAGTDPAKLKGDPERLTYPDYDWTLQISYKNADGSFTDVTDPVQNRYLLLDPYNTNTKSLSEDITNLLAPEDPWGTIGNGSPATLTYRYDMQPTRVVMLPLSITADANRDGKIDPADRDKVTTENPWRFWTNDDNDSGDTGGDDIPQTPGEPGTNGHDHRVNGVRDLIDFFPIDLNLQAALKIFPEGKYRYKLTHAAPQNAPCFKIVQARELHASDSDAYLRDLIVANSVRDMESAPIHAPGRYIDTRFLGAQEQGNGLLLLEAIRPTTEPIKLSIIRKSDQAVMGEVSLPVSISPALDMVRWKFISPGAADLGQSDVPGDPPNWPDADRNGKHFVFVHGYNVNPEQSKGWGTEAFKKIFWSGSEARFSVFAWFGYESQAAPGTPLIGGLTPNYQINLLNSFGTAKSFQQFLDLIEGEVTVAAHSMGNILVGSAMHDWGARPKYYLMLNSAAAKECYDGTEADDAAQDSSMTHLAWAAYDRELRASEWHKLAWPGGDKRSSLTWRNRLRGVIDNGGMTDVYNFYSTGEEVLNNAEANNPSIDPANPFGISSLIWTTANKTWAIQEKRKGFGLTGVIHTSNYGGWLPNLLPYHSDLHMTVNGPWGAHRMRTQSELPPSTDTVWLAKLRTRPFFNTSNHPDLYTAQAGSGSPGSDYAQQHRNTLIAEVIPCTTFAAGRNRFNDPETSIPLTRHFDMNTTMMTDATWWPHTDVFQEDENDAPARAWLHSDLRAKAYSHNWKLYDKFVEIGNLK